MKRITKTVVLLLTMLFLLCAAQSAFALSAPVSPPVTPFYILLTDDITVAPLTVNGKAHSSTAGILMRKGMIVKVVDTNVDRWTCEYQDPAYGLISFMLQKTASFMIPDEQSICEAAYDNQGKTVFGNFDSWILYNWSDPVSHYNGTEYSLAFMATETYTGPTQLITVIATEEKPVLSLDPVDVDISIPLKNNPDMGYVGELFTQFYEPLNEQPSDERSDNHPAEIWYPASVELASEIHGAYGNDIPENAVIQTDGNGNYRYFIDGVYISVIWPLPELPAE